MPDFKEQYKNPRSGFGDTNHRRYLRACNYDKSRKEARARTFDKRRNLQNDSPTNLQHEVTSTITDERMKKLIKWREERNKKKKLEAAMKKPAFKVGVVHHSLCSPIIKSGVAIAKTPNKTENSNYIKKRITRATEKRLLAKAATQQTKMPLFGLVPMKGTPQEKYPSLQTQTSNITEIFKTPIHPKLSLNKQKSSQKLSESIIRDPEELNTIEAIEVSLKDQAENQTDTPDSLHEENSSSSSTDTKTPPKITSTPFGKENCDMEDLICFSPYLTRTRGKRNSRIEGQQRLGIGRRSDEIPTKDTVMKNLNICVEEEERTAQYFMLIVNKETDRLKELCKKWLDIGVEKDVSEDAMYEIQQAVGQTNLLINKKFERFRGLVQDCETGKGEMLVTCKDLQGFWDMTYMEVKDCDMRFEKLEQRQNRGWQEEEYIVIKPAVKKQMAIKKRTVSSKPSSLRSLILAARKNMEEGTLSKDIILPQDTRLSEKPSNRKSFTELRDENTSIRRSISRFKSHDLERKLTPARRESSTRVSSIQKVQFSDKTKRMKSPFAAMKISQMCKTPEVQLDDTISYVNSDQTPGKSILKKSEELENKEARIKSAHKVNFDDQVCLDNIPLNEEMQTKLNLSATLTRVDSSDKIDPLISPPINAEKRLDFEDSGSDDDLNKLKIKIKTGKRNKPKSSVQNTLDTIEHLSNDKSSVSIKELSSDNNEKIVSSRKSLRNRIQHKDTPNRKSVDTLFSPSSSANRDDKMATTEIISKDMEDEDLGMKVLRNRTILANNTPKSNRSSKMMTPKKTNIDKEENENLVKFSSKTLKLLEKNKDKHMALNTNDTMQIENVTLIGNTSKKRSLRNVAFDETCVVCTENKPVLPMTPYSKRRSKTLSRHSLKNRNKSIDTVDEDLISWDTPDKKYRPRRVTRSSHSNNL
ncbi:PREDICTED: uncharacterized protein LOC108769349 isoform X2 [Trachymyrmex cornetzi]|uniref:uncharacterized protein LOC108769349 isoform X2 n=1 Tax=Trachymyrmex cornetzi TaxID=471704 RepID=UPI00084F3A19|nr:PREDICTED: uncharacterized protein LOC108769349 isoform X2 [Trachymyrmex cornetzi]